jgi:hypothetical protein
MEQVIPPDVGQFILEHIDSIAELEAVLLLRESPDSWWKCSHVAARLYITENSCLPVLKNLCRRGLLLCEDDQGFRYRPETGDLREMVDRLAFYYTKHLVPVSNLVHAKARARIEGFAQAFKLSPKNKE